jgi:DNA helicase-2/ATP-dependent DNA helicase PcrA
LVNPDEAVALVKRHLRAPYAYPALREKLEQAARRIIEGYIRKNAADLKNYTSGSVAVIDAGLSARAQSF